MSQTHRGSDNENVIPDAEILFKNINSSQSISVEDPIEEWSSLLLMKEVAMKNQKRKLWEEGSYSPGSGEICAKYLRMSDSSVYRHPYFNYPAVLDPGIETALLKPIPERPPYPDDGYELYLDLCKEHNVAPVHLFYSNLLNSEINLSHYCPCSANVRMMAIALANNRYVKRFDLTNSYINKDACYHIGQMIETNRTLEELILDGCNIGIVGLRNIGNKIHLNTAIKTISLARNDLNDEGGELFASFIRAGANFNRINLKRNNLGIKTALALHDALIYKNILTYLDISRNPFVNVGSAAKFLTTLAETSKSLEELNLSFMGFNHERIAEAISNVTLIPSLKFLDISDNRFDDESAALLVQNLRQSKLNTYNLSNNPFSPLGACIILRKLQQRQVKLQNLFLDNICVNRTFVSILEYIRKMKSRKNFVVTHDKVLHDWVAVGADPRTLILRRGEYMGRMKKRNPKDVPMFLYSLSYAADWIRAKEFIVMMKDQKIPVNDDWVAGLIQAFPGPIVDQKPTVDSFKMRDYIKRLWPDLRLPPDWTPPIMIRVDVKRKKVIQKSKSVLVMGKKGKKK